MECYKKINTATLSSSSTEKSPIEKQIEKYNLQFMSEFKKYSINGVLIVNNISITIDDLNTIDAQGYKLVGINLRKYAKPFFLFKNNQFYAAKYFVKK